MTWFLSSGSAGEQVAIHQSGGTPPLGPAEERPAGGGPVQTATQAASEERISGLTRSGVLGGVLVFVVGGASVNVSLFWLKKPLMLSSGSAPTPP